MNGLDKIEAALKYCIEDLWMAYGKGSTLHEGHAIYRAEIALEEIKKLREMEK